MADKKIPQLDAASQINSDALFAVSQQVSGEQKTLKGTVGQVGEYIGGTQTFSGLNTTSKNLVGAINEVAQGGSGGHTILDNEGDSLTQRSNLQFKGAYSEDESTKTVVNVVRSMTQAQFNQLSSDEKVGLINVTDATLPLAEEIDYDNTSSGLTADNIQDAVDELASTIAGTLMQSSDAKLKDIINEELPDVSEIKAVRFTWKENINRDDSEHIGYLAQDVEKVLPFLVKEDAEGHKVLDYIAFLVAKVDSLEKRLAELEKQGG